MLFGLQASWALHIMLFQCLPKSDFHEVDLDQLPDVCNYCSLSSLSATSLPKLVRKCLSVLTLTPCPFQSRTLVRVSVTPGLNVPFYRVWGSLYRLMETAGDTE